MKKSILAVLALIFVAMSAQALVPSDTTIVEFTDKKAQKRITVITPDDNKFEIPINLNLDNLLKELGIDSTQRNKAFVLVSKTSEKQDTILVVSREGQKVKIIANEQLKQAAKDIFNGENPEEQNAENDRFDFGGESDEEWNDQDPQPKNKRFFSKSDFGLYLGLNGFQKSLPDPRSDLRTWKSRYIALSFRKHITLVNGEKTDFALSYAPEFGWYNFMLENNNGIVYQDNQISFEDLNVATKKSKLVIPHLNLPIMLHLGFKEAKFKVGVGGYVGYRIGGYSKVKQTNNNKDRIKSSFGLEDFQYGLTAEIGKRRGFTIFARYQLNDLFMTSQLNALNARPFSLGIRI